MPSRGLAPLRKQGGQLVLELENKAPIGGTAGQTERERHSNFSERAPAADEPVAKAGSEKHSGCARPLPSLDLIGRRLLPSSACLLDETKRKAIAHLFALDYALFYSAG